MVKSKKMSKTSIAVIVLALLLVLSLVMGMTGAWFSKQLASESAGNLQFGSISISTDENAAGWVLHTQDSTLNYTEELMPGDSISYAGTVKNEGDAAYVFVSITGKITLANEGGDRALPNRTGGNVPSGWTQLIAFEAVASATQDQADAYNLLLNLGENDEGFAEVGDELPAVPVAGVYYCLMSAAPIGNNAGGEGAYDTKALALEYVFDGPTYDNVYQGATVSISLQFKAIQQANLASAYAAWSALDR